MARSKTTEETPIVTPFDERPKGTAAKLSEVMRRVGAVYKASKNDAQGYAYTSAEDVLRRVQTEAASLQLCVQSAASLEKHEMFEQNSKRKVRAIVKITLAFIDGETPADGSRGYPGIQMEAYGEGVDSGDKAIAKANTAALKYALCAGFLIAFASDDPEADSSTDRDAAAKPAEKAAEKPSTPSPKKTTPSANAVVQAIETATLENLQEVRAMVLATRGTPDYDALVVAIKAKQRQLGFTQRAAA